MNGVLIRVGGVDLIADVSGALWWSEERLLAVADLHLEKGSAFAARGMLLPPYDTRRTLERLDAVIGRLRPRMVACLGDSFHDDGAAARLPEGERVCLARLVGGSDWIWIAGNHDPGPPHGLGGCVVEALRLGSLVFRHQASEETMPSGEISGHFHPKAVVRTRGRALHARCFATDGKRLVLPAFGAYAGGLNVLDPAMRSLFDGTLQIHALGERRVHTIAARHLLPA